jgi:hypothetical protein
MTQTDVVLYPFGSSCGHPDVSRTPAHIRLIFLIPNATYDPNPKLEQTEAESRN